MKKARVTFTGVLSSKICNLGDMTGTDELAMAADPALALKSTFNCKGGVERSPFPLSVCVCIYYFAPDNRTHTKEIKTII